MTETLVKLIGVALGALLWNLPYLFYHAGSPHIAVTLVALSVTAAGLSLLCPGARWQTGSGVGLGPLVVIVVQIIVAYSRDPTSHNLAGLEIMAALVIGLPPTILGVLLGNFVRPKVSWPQFAGIVLMTLAMGGAVVPQGLLHPTPSSRGSRFEKGRGPRLCAVCVSCSSSSPWLYLRSWRAERAI